MSTNNAFSSLARRNASVGVWPVISARASSIICCTDFIINLLGSGSRDLPDAIIAPSKPDSRSG
jgi:hypothetical protein